MRILNTLAFLCVVQAIAGQVVHGEKNENHVTKPVNTNQVQAPGQQGHHEHTQQHNNKEQHIAKPSEQNVVQHVTEAPKKVTVEIPSKVQQIVTHVSQHIPQVIEQHVANKQRVVRSVKNRMGWQEMQVNAVEQPGKCEFNCSQEDPIVCGYNGQCYFEFKSQCDLSTYNCLNTQKIFYVVDFAKCQDVGSAKCYRGDF